MALNVNIFGDLRFEDLPNRSIADYTEHRAAEALAAFSAAEDLMMNQMLALLSDEGTDVQTEFGMGFGGRLQKLSEHQNAEATRFGDKWTVAFPIDAYGDRSLYSSAYLDEASLSDINQDAANKFLKDVDTLLDEHLRAILTKANYTFSDGEWPGRKTGLLTIRKLANADSQAGSIANDVSTSSRPATGPPTAAAKTVNSAATTSTRRGRAEMRLASEESMVATPAVS